MGYPLENFKSLQNLVKFIIVFSLYFMTARMGLELDAVSHFATLVWPPTGIALAVLVLYGYGLWPAIFLSAVAVNFSTGAPLAVAIGIGAGNTLEAVAGLYILNRFTNFRRSIERLTDMVALVFIVATVTPLISATIGVVSLWLGNVHSLEGIAVTWRAWWVGDALGDIIVAPLILVWSTVKLRNRPELWRVFEALLLATLLPFVGLTIFSDQSHLAFWFFPFVVWGALRFGQVGNVTVVFVISAIAIWGTSKGFGPFAQSHLRNSLLLLHTFMVVIATTGMTLASSLAERKFAMRATKEEEAQKSSILTAALDCIVIMNHTGHITEFNPAAEKTFGYKRAEVIGRMMDEVIIPERFREAHRRGLAHYLATGEEKVIDQRLELPALRRDGTEFPVEITITQMPIRGSIFFTGFIRDITQQKKSEEQQAKLLHSEEMAKQRLTLQYRVMSTLADSKNLEDGVAKILKIIGQEMNWDFGAFWLVDNEKQVLKSTQTWHADQISVPEFIKATKTLQFLKGQGLPGRIWQTGKPAWISNVIDDLNFPRQAIARQEGLHGGFGFPILSGEKVFGVIEFLSRDIRAADEELLQAVAISGGQMGQFMNRLIAENSLRHAVEARDEFLSIASHELKTPLTSLSLQIQLTRQKIKPEQNLAPAADKLAKVFDVSEKQVARLSGLIEDLLDVSRIQTGKFSFNFERINLTLVVRDMVDRFTDQIKKAGCTLEVFTAENIVGDFDQTRIEQVVDNLLSNAIKYASGTAIKITLSQDAAQATLTVEDRGPGIALDKQAKIFERFERASESISITGLGLGLFIVKEIAKGHNGSARIESLERQGSKFIIELPLKHRVVTDDVGNEKNILNI